MIELGYLTINFANINISVGNINKNTTQILEKLNNSTSDITIFQEMPFTGISCINTFIYDQFLINIKNSFKYIIDNTTYSGIYLLSIPYKINNSIYKILFLIQNKKIISAKIKNNLSNDEKNIVSNKYLFDNFNINNINIKLSKTEDSITINNKYSLNFFFEDDYINTKSNLNILISSKPYYIDDNSNILNNQYLSKKNLSYVLSMYPSNYESSSNYSYISQNILSDSGVIKYDNSILNNKSRDVLVDLDKPYFKQTKLDLLNNNSCNISLFSKPYKLSLNKYPYLNNINYDNLFKVLINSLDKKLKSLNDCNIVLGFSGGLDSLLALLIAFCATSKNKVFPVLMPSSNNTSSSYDRSLEIVKKLDVNFLRININQEVENINKLINNSNLKNISYENSQARLRTNILMNLSNNYSAIVLGTGDFSEIALGFMTYNGDQMSMYNPNKNLYKTLIKNLLIYLSNNQFSHIKDEILKVVNAPISPELLEGQETEKILGLYEINDFILYNFLNYGFTKEKLIYIVCETFDVSNETSNEYVERFFKLFYKNQFKRNTPEGVNVYEKNNLDISYTSDNEINYEN